MEIRNAYKNDLADIAELQISNWKQTYDGLLSPEFLSSLSADKLLDEWNEYMELPFHQIFVCADNTGFLGFAACRKDEELQNCMYLETLHVSKHARGKGIGTKLIEKVFEYTTQAGMENVSICIVCGNKNARNLYTKLGATHYKYFEDDFHGTLSNSEKLVWNHIGDK